MNLCDCYVTRVLGKPVCEYSYANTPWKLEVEFTRGAISAE